MKSFFNRLATLFHHEMQAGSLQSLKGNGFAWQRFLDLRSQFAESPTETNTEPKKTYYHVNFSNFTTDFELAADVLAMRNHAMRRIQANCEEEKDVDAVVAHKCNNPRIKGGAAAVTENMTDEQILNNILVPNRFAYPLLDEIQHKQHVAEQSALTKENKLENYLRIISRTPEVHRRLLDELESRYKPATRKTFVNMRYHQLIELICVIDESQIMELQRIVMPLCAKYHVSVTSTLHNFNCHGIIEAFMTNRPIEDEQSVNAFLQADAEFAGADSMYVKDHFKGLIVFNCSAFHFNEVAAKLAELKYHILALDVDFEYRKTVTVCDVYRRNYELFLRQLLMLPGVESVADNLLREDEKAQAKN